MLGFIDKGDLDVAVKFGYIGLILLYAVIVYLIRILLAVARKNSEKPAVHCLAVATMLMVFLIVQPVHAPLTHSFGLLPLGIALGLIDREQLLLLSKS